MNKFVEVLKTKRSTIVNVLMWEICKVRADAEKEFDRTMDYIVATIKAAKELRNAESTYQSEGGVIAQIRRSPIGVMLNLGEYFASFSFPITCIRFRESTPSSESLDFKILPH
jgi:glyceraldehyde-3-phosphate dehydrogenase (NADP+)